MFSRGAQVATGILVGVIAAALIFVHFLVPESQKWSATDIRLTAGGILGVLTSIVCFVPYGRPYTLRLYAVIVALSVGYLTFNLADHLADKQGARDVRALFFGSVVAIAAAYYAIVGVFPDRVLKVIIPHYEASRQSSAKRKR